MTEKLSYFIFLTISVFALFVAYLAEYLMHFTPCTLCIYQRFPYLILIFIAIIALSSKNYKIYNKYFLVTIIFAIIISAYHSGVELGIFELSSFCKSLISIKDNITTEDFQKMLYSKDLPLCNKPALVVFGLSMTQWNFLFNNFLLIFFLFNHAKAIFSK